MAICDVCGCSHLEEDSTTVIPSKYLGNDFPNKGKFCPICFGDFVRKAKKIIEDQEKEKKEKLKNFTNN